MLWKTKNRKLATISISDVIDPPLPATACVLSSVPQHATLREQVRSGTLPFLLFRRNVSMLCLFCCDAADEMLTCFFLCCILFERDPAVSDAGADIREIKSTMWPCALDVRRSCLHNIRRTFSVSGIPFFFFVILHID